MNWGGTTSLKAWIRAGTALFETGLPLFGMGQSHMDVLSLDPGCISLCTHSAGGVYISTCAPGHVLIQFSYPISLQVACIELVWCHRNMQIGNIDFTCTCGWVLMHITVVVAYAIGVLSN